MKKYLFLIAAAAAMVLASCQPSGLEVEVSDASSGLVTITITASLDEATKATVDDGAKKWVWSEGDQLAVFDGVAKRTFDIKTGVGTSIATFTGDVDGGAVALNAVFPYSAAGATYEDYTIPAVQTVTAAAVADPAAMVATATGEKDGGDYNFTFTSAVSFMRFTSDAAGRFIFHAVDKGDKMTGDGRVVAVDAPSAGTWWVAVKPATYTGLRVFRRIAGHDYLVKSDAALNLSTPGAARELGTINSTSTEVVAIETADELIAYLGGSPARDAYICADLDMTAKSVTTCASYALNFDGQYHKIKNWTCADAPLFGLVTTAGVVRNVIFDSTCSLTKVRPEGNGFLARALSGKAIDCHNYGSVNVTLSGDTIDENGDPLGTTSIQAHKIAGLVGRMPDHSAQMIDCSNNGDITVTVTITEEMGGTQYIGGVVGHVGAPDEAVVVRLNGCSNTGNVTVSVTSTSADPSTDKWLSHHFIGGVAGATGVNAGDAPLYYGEIRDCVNDGNVSASWSGGTGGYFKVGGVIGYCEGALFDCTNNGAVGFTNSDTIANAGPSVGGVASVVAGAATINAKDCHNTGAVSLSGMFGNAAAATGSGTAGIIWATCGGCFGTVGTNSTIVQDCTNTGVVTVDGKMLATAGSSSSVGGVIGVSMANVDNCDFTCASTSSFSGMTVNDHMAGIVGYAYKNVSYCDLDAPINFTHDESSLTKNKGACYHNVGGIVGYAKEGGLISHCTTSASSVMNVSTTGEMRLGGIVGMSYVEVSDCTNSAPVTLTRKYVEECAKISYSGGVVGLQNANYDVKNNTNYGDLDITLVSNSAKSYTAGIVGLSKGDEVSSCNNNGDITFDGGAMTTQNYVAGIVAYTNIAATCSYCSNSGDITASNWACTSNMNYVAGIYGNYNKAGNTYSNLTNFGNISSSAASMVSVAGIAGQINTSTTATYIHNSGNITVTGATAGSRIGGITGYWGNGSLSNASNSGIVSGNAANTSWVSAMVGSLNVNSTWTDITAGGSVSTNSGNKIGSLLGNLSAASKTLTLSGTNIITATVNGDAATSENAIGDLNSGTLVGY